MAKVKRWLESPVSRVSRVHGVVTLRGYQNKKVTEKGVDSMYKLLRWFIGVSLIILFWWAIEKIVYRYIWCRLVKGLHNPPRKIVKEA